MKNCTIKIYYLVCWIPDKCEYKMLKGPYGDWSDAWDSGLGMWGRNDFEVMETTIEGEINEQGQGTKGS